MVPSVHVVLAALPALLVLRVSKVFAVKPVSPAQLEHPEVVDREVFPVFLAKMVKLVKMAKLDPPVLLAPLVLEDYPECPVYRVSKATVVSPVWTDLKVNLAQVVKKEHRV